MRVMVVVIAPQRACWRCRRRRPHGCWGGGGCRRMVVAAVIDARWWWLMLLGAAVVAVVWSALVAGLRGVRAGRVTMQWAGNNS